MRIAFIVAIFPPEPEPAAVMAGEMTRNWASAGHDVYVICPTPNRPRGAVYPGFRRSIAARSLEGGCTVSRVWSWLIGTQRRAADRFLENLTFGTSSALELARLKKPDVLIVESWPIIAYLPVLLVAHVRRIPMLNYIQDVYPEAAVSGGQLLAGSVVTRLLSSLDRGICRFAARNIVVSEGMRHLLVRARRLPGNRFFLIENWLDISAMRPTDGSVWRVENGIAPDDFVALFAGTMGFASGVDVLVEVAERLRGEKGVRLVCVGDGVLREKMARRIAERGLANLRLLPFQPRERVCELHSAADVALLTMAPDVGSSSVPSKLITYLATGRPVICAASADSDVARVVREERLGEVVEPGSADALAAAILKLRSMRPEERLDLGRRARMTAERRYSLEAALRRFTELFREIGLTPEPPGHRSRVGTIPTAREGAPCPRRP